jgi:alkanesulfonate monooxygenase SsuD/methylene tetrahydromethanopterin reductase-like flavin-dependent oxidoreductase (luciferase family)
VELIHPLLDWSMRLLSLPRQKGSGDMTKYGRPLKFGFSPNPTAADPTRPVQLACLAETLGLDYVGVQEHLYSADYHDTWTLLTAIGTATSRISLFTTVADLHLRSPSMLAKAAASLDLLTGGRLEVALDVGILWKQLVALGGEKGTDETALAALEEAMQVMHLMWIGDRSLHFKGAFYELAELEPGLAPARPVNIWLGVNEPQALALTGRLANGWIADCYPRLQPGDLAGLSKQLDDAATLAGRQHSEIQRVWNIKGTIGSQESTTYFEGSPRQWAEALAQLAVNVGIDTFLLMEGEDAEEQLERFALEVVPLTREVVEQAPGASITTGLSRAIQGAKASGPTRAEEETDNVDWVDATSMESFPASDPPASASFI